ncbi:MAG: SGNH/GDSL hydrolase family protein [Lachnospiraceae bacterium]|nr:SGNH/GDSL hydrolase family protein [Lachnospiraceae bacterium]
MSSRKAPTDPVKKRPGFYIMFEKQIEATKRDTGVCSQEIYLNDGRLVSMAKIAGNIKDESMLSLIRTAKGFRKLTDSIGICVTGENHQETIWAVFQMYGRQDMYGGGTIIRVPVFANGAETIIRLQDIVWSDDDDIPGKLSFEFEEAGELATATVKLYLNEGYEAPECLEEDPPVLEGVSYQNMIAKSLLSLGDGSRIRKVIKKAQEGKTVTIAYIGGSITQGAGAKPIHTNCYAYRSYEWFRENYGCGDKSNVRFIKAGVGGTPSELGMIRYQEDVLRGGTEQPDFVIVEFAVNDEGDETRGECYESLIREILNQGNEPAVLLLFAVFADDFNLQDRLAPIGYHYHLPMVSVKDAVVDQFYDTKNRVISKNQYFYDCYHPTNLGHKIMADSIRFCIEQELKQQDLQSQDKVLYAKPFMGRAFEQIRMFDRRNASQYSNIQSGDDWTSDTELQCVEMDANPYQTPEFTHNWMHTPSCTEHTFCVTVKSEALFLVYKDSGDNAFGTAEIYIDGTHARTADPHVNGWTHCNAILLYANSSAEEHTVEIKADPEKKFTILAFATATVV